MKIDAAQLKVLIPRDQIAQLNTKLGDTITKTYSSELGHDEKLLVLVTLKGAAIFAADLVREIRVPLVLDFVRLASYGAGTSSSGSVEILKDIEMSVEARHVLVLDEIVDSGHTLQFFLKRLRSERPKSLRVCTLLSKPSRREVEVQVDFIGAEVEDRFLVGYGLDYKEQFRNLADISYVPEV